MIYLDYNATAPYSLSVRNYIENGMKEDWANASSEHDLGYLLNTSVKNHRKNIAEFLDCSTKQLFFTSGATESINTILSLDNLEFNKVNTIISSPMEHHAVIDRLNYLEKKGVNIILIGNNNQGVLDYHELETVCQNNPEALVSLMFVNNETGVINDVKKMIDIAHSNSCLVHVDAVQALGKIQFSLHELSPDFASFSGHKIGSMKGIGLLFCSDDQKLSPLMHGGGQERGFRPGTYNYPAIKSFRLAINDIDFSKLEKIKELRDKFERTILEVNKDFEINAIDALRVFNTSNIYLGGMDASSILLNLSRKKIYVSTGSACSSGSISASHVIKALGHDEDYARSSLRFSFGELLSESELEIVLSTLKKVIVQ